MPSSPRRSWPPSRRSSRSRPRPPPLCSSSLGIWPRATRWSSAEKQRLAGQLQVAEAEKRLATEQVARMQEEVKVERAEKGQADRRRQDARHRPGQVNPGDSGKPAPGLEYHLQPVRLQPRRGCVLGRALRHLRHRVQQAHPDADGAHHERHQHRRPLPCPGHPADASAIPGTDWEGLSGTLGRSGTRVPIQSLAFYQLDPRIVFLPVTAGAGPRARR